MTTTPDVLKQEQLKERYKRNFRDQLSNKPLVALKRMFKGYRYGLFGGLLRTLHPNPPQRFMLICRARSGSNFLLTLLETHPRLRQIWEPFGEHQLRQPDRIREINTLEPLPYLEAQLKRVADEKIVGFKILYHQYEEGYPVKWEIPSLAPVREALVADAHLKVIHLKRQNILRSFASSHVAQETRQFIIFDEKRRKSDIRITLTPEACEREFTDITEKHAQFDALFAEHPLLTVTYEDLSADPQSVGREVQAFLGLKPRQLRTVTVKQNVRPLSDVISNYADLKAHFASTQWAAFFDD